MKKSDLAKASVIDLLLEAGFIPDGDTHSASAPASNYMRKTSDQLSKEWATAAARLRFKKPGTNIKATVGARTTAIYKIDGKGLNGVKGLASIDTSQLCEIAKILNNLNLSRNE